VPEHDGTVLVGVLVEHDRDRLAYQQLRQPRLALAKRRGRRSSPSSSSKSKPNSRASVALCRRWSASNTATPAHRRLAVDRERFGPQLRRGARDRRVSIGPIIAPPGKQAHHLADTADDQPVTVVLDLVDPAGPGRRLGGARGCRAR
jgi:hypothetical protein